jgi:hypothetical protein
MHVVRGARTTGLASFDLCSKIKGAMHISYILLYFFLENGRDFPLLRLRTQRLYYYMVSATLLKINQGNKKCKCYA